MKRRGCRRALGQSPLAIRTEPAETRRRAIGRDILQTDPSGIAGPLQVPQYETIGDLARAGFMAARMIGDLDMIDPVAEPVIAANQIAASYLLVIEVVLQKKVLVIHTVQDA